MHQQPEIVSNETIFSTFTRNKTLEYAQTTSLRAQSMKGARFCCCTWNETSKRARSFHPKRGCTRHWFCVYKLQLLQIPVFYVRFIVKYTNVKRVHDTYVCQTSYTAKGSNRKTIFAICWTPTGHATPTTFNETRMTNETTLARKSYQQNNS